MKEILAKKEFDFVRTEDKEFILAFNTAMEELGYTCGNEIGAGHCWGKFMIVYTKGGVKSKKSYARVYIRDNDIVLRLYFSDIDKHAQEIGQAPNFVQEAFIGKFPSCGRCHEKTKCIHQKRYSILGKQYEICNGKAFWFFEPIVVKLPEYLKLFTMFYPAKIKNSVSI